MRVGPILTALVAFSPVALNSQIPIRVGQAVVGRLVQADQKFADGSRYKMYAFVGNKGDTVAVDLTSDDFDANILVADASGNSLARNDDGGGRCNARVAFVPPATGNYRVYANSSAQAELGEYRLTLARGHSATPLPADTVCKGFGRVAGLVEVGQTITGTLSSDDPEFPGDSTYFERWILPVKANQAFTIDLVSDDFDAYLLLTKGRGEKLVDNDDGGGGCNARIVYTAQDDHPLRVVVNTASRPRRQTGKFTLRVTEGESGVETKGNCRFTNAASASYPDDAAVDDRAAAYRPGGARPDHPRRRNAQRHAVVERLALSRQQLLQVLSVHCAGGPASHHRSVIRRLRPGVDHPRRGPRQLDHQRRRRSRLQRARLAHIPEHRPLPDPR